MGLSARRLGEKIGLTAEQTNTLLKESGFQKGNPGEYIVTEKGKKYVEEKSWDNGYGGWAARGYDYNEWDESIINKLDTSSENLQKIRDLTTQRRKERRNNTCNTQYNEKNNNDDYDYQTDYSINKSTDSTAENVGAGIGLIIAAGLFLFGIGKGIYENIKEKKSKEPSVKKKSLKERLFKKNKNND